MILSFITTSPNYENIRVWAGGNYVSRSLIGHTEFCNAISNNWTPVWLSLEDTIFGSNVEQIVDILTSLRENTVIEYLDLSYPQFKVNKNVAFSLQDFMIAEKACAAIGKIMRANGHIKELILQGNPDKQWGPSLGANLSGLEVNKSLERLNISGNSISESDLRSLSEILVLNSKLKYLNIDENMAYKLSVQDFKGCGDDLLLEFSNETFGKRRDPRMSEPVSPTKRNTTWKKSQVENGNSRNAIFLENMNKIESVSKVKVEEDRMFQRNKSYYI
ncbi:4307_t:CDS:2 [Scutellospora calospora]|uniref:4307_t:CDS:1 n=1 Tax=Scutellospora calospora TaxID=85575 RepID=A0ACA9KS47_9GLOM|nr:4307_t:CDS:2 [Scutellospora calospora]